MAKDPPRRDPATLRECQVLLPLAAAEARQQLYRRSKTPVISNWKNWSKLFFLINCSLLILLFTFLLWMCSTFHSTKLRTERLSNLLDIDVDNTNLTSDSIDDLLHSQPNTHPIYLYLAGVEGSGHHAIEPVIEQFMNATGMYQWRMENGQYALPQGTNDSWILSLIQKFQEWDGQSLAFFEKGEGMIPMYIMGSHGSFPAYLTRERKDFANLLDSANPTQTLENHLHILQQKRQPFSLLQHASFGRNILRTTYDFKVVWIQRDFVSAVFSRWRDWNADGHFNKHALMMAINELYIATELMFIEAAGLGNCVKIHVDLLNNTNVQADALKNISRLLNIDVPVCDKCFEKYKTSTKHPRKDLSKSRLRYIDNILVPYLDRVKAKFNICNG